MPLFERAPRAPIALALLFASSVSACGGGTKVNPPTDTRYRAECDNVNPEACVFPWPSSRYLVADATTATGFHVSIPQEAMPDAVPGVAGTGVDPSDFNRWDGFTGQTSFVTMHRGVLDPTQFADWLHIADSVASDSHTIVLDATTGELLPHYAELDMHFGYDDDRRPLYIRPAKRMPEHHHIVVALRNVKSMDGTTVAAYEGFAALRDKKRTAVPGLEARRAHFESDVFAPLVANGIDRASLVEAWDIVVGSDVNAWGDAVEARDRALAVVGANGLGCTITSVTEPTVAENANVFRRVEGTVTVPLFTDSDSPGSALRRDADGKPLAMGTAEYPFLAIIPRSVQTSVAAGGAKARLIQYGHGLLGSRTEAAGGYMTGFANAYPSVIVAGDWTGMAKDDFGTAASTLGDLSTFPTFVDRQVQGMINQVVLMRTMKGVCASEAELAIDASGTLVPAYDVNDVYYHGNSQGGIFGMTYAALAPDVTRFGIGVGGASYAAFMPRSVDWTTYEVLLNGRYPDPIDRSILEAMLSQWWERSDPSAFTPYILHDFRTGAPTGKHVLMQSGRWDAQVANVGSDIAARNIGIPAYAPGPYPVYGLSTFTSSSPDGYVLYDTHASPVPDDFEYAADEPIDSSSGESVHESVRRDPRAQQQLDAFLRPTGVVQTFCTGACN